MKTRFQEPGLSAHSIETGTGGPMPRRTMLLPTCTTIKVTPANGTPAPFLWHGEADTRLSQLHTDVLAEPSCTAACPCYPSCPAGAWMVSAMPSKYKKKRFAKNLFHQNKVNPCPKYEITEDFQELLINSSRSRELTIHRSHWDLFAFISTEGFPQEK